VGPVATLPRRTGVASAAAYWVPVVAATGLGTARVGTAGGLAVTGPMAASRPVDLLRIAALHVRLPVYPDGPVTVTVPVRATGAPGAAVVVSTARAARACACCR
jgi:hypothetical protein